MTLVLLISGIVSIFQAVYPSGVYAIVAAGVNGLIFFMMPKTVFGPLDQGRFRDVSDRLLIWGVLALIFGVVGGILLLIAFVQLQEVFQPHYQQYPPGQYYQQPRYQQPQYQQQYRPAQAPPQAPQRPAPVQPSQPLSPSPAPPAEGQQKVDLRKCRSCGVQYPSFMMSCPNCGAPRN